jgi:hypothetical protein
MIQGTFHFHSTYSHDGRSTLWEIASALGRCGLSFCILTDHFEDFDAPKFDNYLREVREVTEKTGFLLIPGTEVNLAGLDTILFPAFSYGQIADFAAQGHERDSERRLYKVLAHASKYPFEMVVKHLERYKIEGVELWNQQADSRYIPPFKLLEMLEHYSRRKQYRYFFGCDLHNVNLTVANLLSLPSPGTAEAIVHDLTEGDFTSRNIPTGIEYRNGSDSTDFDEWLRMLHKSAYRRGRFLGGIRTGLKSVYRMLPRDTQKSLNDVKNFVRNKV